MATNITHVDDSANLTMPHVRAKAQHPALEHGLDLVVVDYLFPDSETNIDCNALAA